MDYKSSNQFLINLPLINLPQDECDSVRNNMKSQEKDWSNCHHVDNDNDRTNTIDDQVGEQGNYRPELKLRSSSVVSETIDKQFVDECSRTRAGSLFIPNLCVHCKLMQEIENKEIKCNAFVSNYSDEEELTVNSCKTTTSGSMISSRSSSPADSSSRSSMGNESNSPPLMKEFGQFLQVPNWKPRASSLDSGIINNELIKDHGRRISFEEALNTEKPRATSVDVHFQPSTTISAADSFEDNLTEKRKSSKGRFSIISISSRQVITKVIQRLKKSKFRLNSSTSKTEHHGPQWSENTQSREHIWYADNSVRHRCNVINCSDYNTFELYKCSVCKTASCCPCKVKINNTCRKTFYTQNYNELDFPNKNNNSIYHHWIHRTCLKGICKSCSKSLHTQHFLMSESCISAIQCTWCKASYHNKSACFTKLLLSELCSMGSLKALIIPPSLIIKYRNPEHKSTNQEIHRNSNDPFGYYTIHNPEELFIGKFVLNSFQPILALINPKSGGKQGIEVLYELQWILNPRQVFDISAISPEIIIRFYRSIKNLRLLIGGGDGTINWMLKSIETSLKFSYLPPIAVIPLGTGNDLSRELNWGSSYNSNESLLKLITDIEYGSLVNVDIWKIFVHNISSSKSTSTLLTNIITPTLPVEKFNNYFSLGSDAATALEFHQNRERNPHRFSSRLKNKLCYVEIGGKDVIKREYKNLTDSISLTCDGISYDSRLAQLRPHCILFLNITNYSAGTNPWGKGLPNSQFVAQSINDRLLEVIGLSAASLATLHMGGKGDRICQCRTAEITIQKDTPIQIDGEPILILPCIIKISHKMQYPFIKRNNKKSD